MKKILNFILLSALFNVMVNGQMDNSYNPDLQDTCNIQYFTPFENDWYSGDPIPFYKDGRFHVFYLTFSRINESPEGRKNQWAHFSTTDLIHWKHHPMAIPITQDWENNMATGSVIYNKDSFTAFYTTFRKDEQGQNIQYVSKSISEDGILFYKQEPNKFITPPENYSVNNFRDPHVFFDDQSQLYYLIITTEKINEHLDHLKPCIIYYTSEDLLNWEFRGDFYLPGNPEGYYYPECPTLFKWNDWYYLMYKQNGGTYYRISHKITGPWFAPREDNIGNDYALVHKVAEFTGNRRIAVGMIPSKKDEKDNGGWEWGGNMVFRELHQNPDGSLYTGMVREMLPIINKTLEFKDFSLNQKSGFISKTFEDIPADAHIGFEIIPGNDYEQSGLLLRYSEEGYYELKFNHRKRQVSLGDQTICGVYNLDKKFSVDIYMSGNIIDVCIDGKRCILNRAYEQKGSGLIFYVRNGVADYENIKIDGLKLSKSRQ